MKTVTVSPRFKVVIPLEVRRQMKLEPGTKLMVMELAGSLRMVPLKSASELRGIAHAVTPGIDGEADRLL